MMTNPPRSPHNDAILIAREVLTRKPVYLDTETTGLSRSDEIIEISIVDDDNQVLFESLVRPTQSISPDAMAVHGISNEVVRSAPTWPAIWPTLRTHIVGHVIGIYNAEFDLRMMQQSHGRYRLPWKENLKTVDIMLLYAQFKGDWDSARRGYRYHSLDRAGKDCHISLPNAHRAVADTLLTRALLHFIAESEPN